MNAQARYRQNLTDAADPSMKGPLIGSALFHAGLFILTTLSLPFITQDSLTVSTPIPVEIVEIADVTQTNKPPPPAPQPEVEKPVEKKQAEPEAKPTPPKMTEEAPAPPVPAPEKKAEVEKPKPKPPEPKKPEPKKEEKKTDDFQTLLKNLTPDAPEKTPAPKTETTPRETAEDSPDALLSDRLTISELDAFKRQIEPCWNVPAGVEYAEKLAVEIRVTMNRDMTVQSASILDQGRYNRDSPFRAAADAALRALRNPRCSPLRLPADKYEEWKTIVIRFDPSEML